MGNDSETPNSDQITSSKRPVGNTSFDELRPEGFQLSKKSTVVAPPSPINSQPVSGKTSVSSSPNSSSVDSTNSLDSALILESLDKFALFFNNINVRFDAFEKNIQDTSLNLANNTDVVGKVNDKMDQVLDRLTQLEAHSSQQEIKIAELYSRLEESEARGEALRAQVVCLDSTVASLSNSNNSEIDWEPKEVSDRKILGLGDSNFSGKIRFGDSRGTLGRSLPGTSLFTPVLSDLPDPSSDRLKGYSDIVIATGTNDLAQNNTNAVDLSREVYSYIKRVLVSNPTTQITLPGVLPTMSSDRNNKINKYNLLLDDMCRVHPRLTFVDLNNLRGNNGLLTGKFAVGGSDSVHLNAEGIKVYASRLKSSLRHRHHLPTFMGNRSQSRPHGTRQDGPGNPTPVRGGSRGRGSGRGSGGTRGGNGGSTSRGGQQH